MTLRLWEAGPIVIRLRPSRTPGPTRRPPSRPPSRRLVAAVATGALVVGAALNPSPAGGQVEPETTTTTAPATTTTSSSTTTTTTIGTTTVPETSTTSEPTESTTTTTPAAPLPVLVNPARAAQLKALQSEFENLTAQEVDLFTRYLVYLDQSEQLGAQIDRLTLALSDGQTELALAEAKIEQADTHVADVDARLDDAETNLAREQKRLQNQAIDAYVGGGLGGSAASTNAVLKAQSVDDVGKSIVYAESVMVDQRTAIRRVTDLRDHIAELDREAVAAQEAAITAHGDLQSRSDGLEAQRLQLQELRRIADESAKANEGLLTEVAAKRDEYSLRISALRQTSGGVGATLAGRQAGQSLPLVTVGIMLPPLVNAVLTSRFGPRLDPVSGSAVSIHQGLDMSAPTGTPIRAAADGVVVIADVQGGYGNCTVIDHGNGLGTLYGHQSAFNVEVGDRVTRGQVIGFVGSTGHSTGPHLHWEVRQFGDPVDPLLYLGPG